MTERTPDDLLTVEYLAEYLHVSVKTARRLHIPHAKVGRIRLYRWRDVVDYLAEKIA